MRNLLRNLSFILPFWLIKCSHAKGQCNLLYYSQIDFISFDYVQKNINIVTYPYVRLQLLIKSHYQNQKYYIKFRYRLTSTPLARDLRWELTNNLFDLFPEDLLSTST